MQCLLTMKYILFLILFFALTARAQNIVLARGQSTKIYVSQDEKIHITNRSVVSVKDQGRYITLTGIKIGYTSVVTAKKIFKILVSSVESARAYEQLKKFIADFQGIRLDAGSDFAEVRGELLRFSDWLHIAEFAKAEKLIYSFDSKLDPTLSREAHAHFRKILGRAELPPVRIVFEGGARAILPKEFDSRKAQYKNVLGPYGIQIEKDNSTIALAPMVEVEILVAEVQRNFLRRFGMSWPQEYQFSVSPAAGQINHGSLEMALQALEQKGNGRILASPKLLCRSGKEAEFLAGGEFPIAIRHKLNSELTWKKHGVILKVKPLADLSGRMSIDIETEVSLVDFKDKSQDLPSFKTNRIKSHFDLEGSRTIALSGLLKSVEANSRRGLPILSELPIIGSLFSSKEFLEERTELVFFVTPRLVPYDTPSVDPRTPEWRPDEQ